MNQGLAALNVIELGGGVAAATASKVMADLGATVVKVEPPGGDLLRADGASNDRARGAFVYLNSNKRSVALALEEPAGQAALAALAARAHLVIHDLAPAAMAAWGVDYARLSATNPALVMLSLTPFGLTGPYRDYAGNDLIAVHAGGWGSLSPGTGTPPGRPPLKPFGEHGLSQTGLHGAVAALAACYGAAESGVGEHIDLSGQQAVAFMMARNFAMFSYAGIVNRRTDPAAYEPYGIYRCRDGFLFIICAEQIQWEAFVQVMGHPDWAADPRFEDRDKRGQHVEELRDRIAAWTADWSVDDLFHTCQRARVGAAPVFTPAQLAEQEHLRERAFFVEQPHGGAVLRVPGAPYALRDNWWRPRTAAPALAEAAADPKVLFPDPPAAPDALPATAPLPLAGVRVLDLSWVWAGPHCSLLLSLLGADVIKVESSGRPDLTRRTTPFPPGMPRHLDHSGYFNQINLGKRSVGINLADPAGTALVKRLAEHSEVMLSNFGTGVLEKLGLAPAEMHRINPNLVVAMISAFGQTGPYRQYMGYGPLIAPLAGVSAHTCYPDGLPQDVGMPYGDPNGGVHAALAILAALNHRRRFGGGQVIDVSMWEAMICTGFEGWMHHALGGPPLPPQGTRDPHHAPHNLYPCRGADQWVAVAVTDDGQWGGLCAAIGRTDLAADPRLVAAQGRKAHEDEIDAALAAWCADRDRWAVTEALQTRGVPAFPCLTTQDLAENPHLNARGAFTEKPHPKVGARKLLGLPWRFERRGPHDPEPAPLLGEHTDAVLKGLLGLDGAEVARLRAAGVVE